MILNSHRPWKPAADDRWLTVISGHLWMSAADGQDHVLGPGQTLELGRKKGWLAQALGHCACEFSTSATPPAGPRSPASSPENGRGFRRSEYWTA